MKSKILPILKLAAAICLFGGILWYLLQKNNVSSVFQNIRLSDFFILISGILLSYIPSGIQMRMLLKAAQTALSPVDTLLLPVSMSLWAYIIPANGGFLYSLYFLSKKYHCALTNSSSVGIFTIYISFILSGICGLILAIFLPAKSALICIAGSVICIFFPFFVRTGNCILKKLAQHFPAFTKLSNFADSIVTCCKDWLLDKKMLAANTFIVLIQLFLTYMLYVWIVLMLKLQTDLAMLFLVVIAQRISSLIRLLPGNLGIEEVVTGVLFALTGLSWENGLLIAAILRCAQICILPLGIIHSMYNHIYPNSEKNSSCTKTI